MTVNTGSYLQHSCDWGRQTSRESDENGIIPEQARVITQVVILDADKKQIQCVVRPLQILRADGTWENIGGMK